MTNLTTRDKCSYLWIAFGFINNLDGKLFARALLDATLADGEGTGTQHLLQTRVNNRMKASTPWYRSMTRRDMAQ
jgi:hypothetical protein